MTYTTTENAKSRLATRNLTLPDLGAPAYSYDAWTRHDDVLYMSGQISRTPNGEVLDGRAGVDATTADAAAAQKSQR